MNEIYLVIIDQYGEEENSIVNICTTLEKAESLKKEYEDRTIDSNYSYHIDVVELDSSKDILWDCYDNSIFHE